jgi:hypothetical protein
LVENHGENLPFSVAMVFISVTLSEKKYCIINVLRNHLNDIYGIWFYEKKDCEKVGQKVKQLVQEVESRLQLRKAGGGGGDLNHILQVSDSYTASFSVFYGFCR